jgi:hypothetical protein
MMRVVIRFNVTFTIWMYRKTASGLCRFCSMRCCFENYLGSGVKIWEISGVRDDSGRPLSYGYKRHQAVFATSNEAVARCSLNES